MVLEKLGSSLKDTLSKIAKAVFVDDTLINELVKDIQRALLQADVNVKLVFSLTQRIKDRITSEKTPPGLTKKEHLIHIVYDELVNLLGGEREDIAISDRKPHKILMVGLFGSGKTTTCGKLARYYSKRGHKVALLGLDVWRPAAMDQLQQVASQANVPSFVLKGEKNPLKILDYFKPKMGEFDIVLIDTAGRDALNNDLIKELSAVNTEVQPNESYLVISADLGQTAQKQAQTFHETVGVTGVIATKMDGTAKAGGALTACAVTDAPIRFIGVGEHLDDLERFNPKGFVGRLLGMGDIEALLEKAKGAITEESAKDLSQRMLHGDYNLIDLFEQMTAMRKMGPLGKIMEMIPGFSSMQLPKEILDMQEGKLDTWKHIMNSCTKEELEDPEIIDSSRADRISRGSGVKVDEVRELVKQYRQSKKMLKMLKGGSPEKIMKKLQKGQIGKAGGKVRLF